MIIVLATKTEQKRDGYPTHMQLDLNPVVADNIQKLRDLTRDVHELAEGHAITGHLHKITWSADWMDIIWFRMMGGLKPSVLGPLFAKNQWVEIGDTGLAIPDYATSKTEMVSIDIAPHYVRFMATLKDSSTPASRDRVVWTARLPIELIERIGGSPPNGGW